MKRIFGVLIFFLILSFCFSSPLQAKEAVRIIGTVLVASNEGSDFNLDNDAYRDRLIQLFSYSAYEQDKEFSAELEKGARYTEALPANYDLMLTLQADEEKRVLIQAVIRKERKTYLDTVLSISKPGVVFLGGPSANGGELILILEAVKE